MSFKFNVSPREMQYGHYVFATLDMLRAAVAQREQAGEKRRDIAARIGMHPASLSRALNGRVSNLTLRTISDILFAAGHSPEEPRSQAWEVLSPNQWDRNGRREDAPEAVRIAPATSKITIIGVDGSRSTSNATVSNTLKAVPQTVAA